MLEFRHIQHIVTLAEHKTFASAAKVLNITQPSLTSSIQKAESILGVKLFNRSSKGVELTSFGEIVISRGSQWLTEKRELQREIDLINKLETGEVTIGITGAAADIALGRILCSMIKQHPNIEVNIKVGYSPSFEEALKSGGIDLFLGSSEFAIGNEAYDIVPIHRFNGWFYCRSGHPILQKRKISVLNVLQYQMAMLDAPPLFIEKIYGMTAKERDEATGRQSHQDINCDDHAIMRSIVANSDVISITMMVMVEQLLEEGKIEVIMKDSPRISTPWGFTTMRNRILSPATSAFIETALDVFEDVYQNEQALMKKYGVSAP
jgi:DNA-binding transcriptional LysR family regulator